MSVSASPMGLLPRLRSVGPDCGVGGEEWSSTSASASRMGLLPKPGQVVGRDCGVGDGEPRSASGRGPGAGEFRFASASTSGCGVLGEYHELPLASTASTGRPVPLSKLVVTSFRDAAATAARFDLSWRRWAFLLMLLVGGGV